MGKSTQTEPAKVKARVLMDCPFGKVDEVVEVTEAEANASTSQLDAHPDAVAYAESLKAQKPEGEGELA